MQFQRCGRGTCFKPTTAAALERSLVAMFVRQERQLQSKKITELRFTLSTCVSHASLPVERERLEHEVVFHKLNWPNSGTTLLVRATIERRERRGGIAAYCRAEWKVRSRLQGVLVR
jgi:hypothetical protein